MSDEFEEQKVEAQQVLDELLAENLLPFKLDVGRITKADNAYTLHFHDSRIYAAEVPFIEGQSFQDSVRQAVLKRVARMSGPLSEEPG
jgi:hypothetical protein